MAVTAQMTMLTQFTDIYAWPGPRPAIYISIEFEIQLNLAMLLFITYAVDHKEILHKSWL